MSKHFKSIKAKDAEVRANQQWTGWQAGCGPVELLAADPAAGQTAQSKGAGKFKMVLYTGATFAGHWYWGNVILDVAGFKPARQDIPAMLDHGNWDPSNNLAGACEKLSVSGKQILAEGWLLKGSLEEEPAANQVLRRLQQGYPYQASGRWSPTKVEEVQAGAKAQVNGETVNGPCTIFREFSVREASFVPLGWDEDSEAVAAQAQEGRALPVEVVAGATKKEQNMTQEAKPSILAKLDQVFGSKRAIELHTAKPEATDLAAFVDEMAQEIATVRAGLATAQGEVTTLKASEAKLQADLAAAQKAPPVITASGDAGQPAPKAPAAGTPEALKAKWEGSAALKAEFPVYDKFVFAVNKGLVKPEEIK